MVACVRDGIAAMEERVQNENLCTFQSDTSRLENMSRSEPFPPPHSTSSPESALESAPPKPFWKKWWVIALGVFVALGVVSAAFGTDDADEERSGADPLSASSPATIAASEATTTPETTAAVGSVTASETSTAPETTPASDTTDFPATTSPLETTAAPESTEPPPTTEPGPELTPSQTNAVRSAESYLDFSGFSRQGLIDQLSSEFGEQFPLDDATFAVDSLGVDWTAQAVRSANSYLDFSGFSRQGLIDQLSSEFGDQYTTEEATRAVDSIEVDYDAQAVRSGESYLDFSGFSCQGLIDQLSSDFGDQYTVEQATFAASQLGLC